MAIPEPEIVLPMESGDRLSQPEFHRRYAAMSEQYRAELVEGVVYVASPVSGVFHARPHADVVGWLATYRAATRGVELLDNATVILDGRNEVQPDAAMRFDEGGDNRSRWGEDGFLHGPPHFVVEVAASSASYDAHFKRHVYMRGGVQEYLLWRTRDAALDWWTLRDDRYVALEPDEDGMLHSRVMPGLVLDTAALLAGDLARVLAVQQAALGTGVHAAFVDRLGRD